jgi:hypothetical protein
VVHTIGEKPSARKNHSMNFINSRAMIVILGGKDPEGNTLSDVWIIDLIKLVWQKINTIPNLSSFVG